MSRLVLRSNVVAAPPGPSEQDWIDRSTAAGVTFFENFNTAASVTNRKTAHADSANITHFTGDSINGSAGCMKIATPAAMGPNQADWIAPLDSSWVTPQQGFGTGYWCMQLAVKLAPNRLTCGSNGGGFKIFNIGECIPGDLNNSRSHPTGEIVLTSKASSNLIPWLYRDIAQSQIDLAEPYGGSGDLYLQTLWDRGSDLSDDNRFCLWHGLGQPFTAGCLTWPVDQWFHLLLEVRTVVASNTPGGGPSVTHPSNRIGLKIQLPGETQYRAVYDTYGAQIGEDDALPLGLNGPHLLQFDTARTGASEDTYALYGGIIVSREFILPAGNATVPNWFRSLTPGHWTTIANSGSARLSQVLPTPRPLHPILGGADTDLACDWNGASVNPEAGEYMFINHGGHSSWAGNDGYALTVRADSPLWKRLSDPTPMAYVPDTSVCDAAVQPGASNPSNNRCWPGGTQQPEAGTGGALGRLLDGPGGLGRPAATHSSPGGYGNNKVFFALSNSYSNSAGDGTNMFYAYDLRHPALVTARAANTPLAHTTANLGPYRIYGPVMDGASPLNIAAGSGWFTFGSSAIDEYTQKLWYFGGKGAATPIAMATDTAFKGDGPAPYTLYKWSAPDGLAGNFFTWHAIAYDLRIGILGNSVDTSAGAGTSTDTVYIFDLDNPAAGLTKITSFSGTGYWGIYQGFLGKCFAGGIYSREDNSVLIGDPNGIGAQIYKLKIPTSGSGFNKTYNSGGTWIWSNSTPSGTGPGYLQGGATSGNTYTRFNKMNMGNGLSAAVVCSDINAVQVLYIPTAGL